MILTSLKKIIILALLLMSSHLNGSEKEVSNYDLIFREVIKGKGLHVESKHVGENTFGPLMVDVQKAMKSDMVLGYRTFEAETLRKFFKEKIEAKEGAYLIDELLLDELDNDIKRVKSP